MLKLKRNEKIKVVDGYEGKYAVTTNGRVWNIRKNNWLKQHKTGRGYYYVTLCKDNTSKNYKVHRLVGLAFVQNPDDKPQINHLNGKKSDNRVSNLKWSTARENMQHACDTGLNKTFKLSYNQKIAICIMKVKMKIKQKYIALQFGVSAPNISYTLKHYIPIALEQGLIC